MANQYTAYTYITDKHKRCSLCGTIKPHSEFHKDKKNKRGKGLGYYCKECANRKSRDNHNTRIKHDPSYKLSKKSAYIKAKYGLSLSEYQAKLILQKNCPICLKELSIDDTNTHLDHCHKTGKIRSFLCGNCNRGIGSFHDEVWKMRNAIKYLESYSDNVDVTKEGRRL